MISVKFSELKSTLISSEIVKISSDSIYHVLFILEGCWNINETRVLVCSVVVLLLLLKMFIHIFTPTTCVIVTRKELLQYLYQVLYFSRTIFSNMEETESVDSDSRTTEITDHEDQEPALSKRAQKKLKKRQDWLDNKQERRKREREKRKLRMAAKKLSKEFTESRTASRKSLKQVKMVESECKVSVVFDMQWSDLMTQRDLGKCLKQIIRCYSYNRRLSSPLQLFMTSHCGKVEEEMTKHDGYRNWDFNFESGDYDSVFPADKIVYLTAESDNVLETLEQDKAYIIGGLVDHNHHKGLCHSKAVEKGVKTARLPIDEFISLKTRKVLTVNHVYEILAEVCQGLDWKQAFLKILPERKGGVALSEDCDEATNCDDSDRKC